MARPEDRQFGLSALKDHALQGGLRGMDQRNGKILPYEVELVGGQVAIVTQESVDMSNLYSTLRQQAQDQVRAASHIENFDSLMSKLQNAVDGLKNVPQQTSVQKKLL